jgi:hypothetical protein
VLSRVSLKVLYPKSADVATAKAAVLLGMEQRRDPRGAVVIAAPQCGDKPYSAPSFLHIPLEDVKCECRVAQFKAEGCYVVKWEEVTVGPPAEKTKAP